MLSAVTFPLVGSISSVFAATELPNSISTAKAILSTESIFPVSNVLWVNIQEDGGRGGNGGNNYGPGGHAGNGGNGGSDRPPYPLPSR